MAEIRDDIKPAAFTGASTAVLGTVGGILPALGAAGAAAGWAAVRVPAPTHPTPVVPV